MLTDNVTSHWHKMMGAYIYRHVQYLICSVIKLSTADFTRWLTLIINWVTAASLKGQNSKFLWKSFACNSRWKNTWNGLWINYEWIMIQYLLRVCVWAKIGIRFLLALLSLCLPSPDSSAVPPQWDPSLWRDKRHAEEFKLRVNLSGVAETFSV